MKLQIATRLALYAVLQLAEDPSSSSRRRRLPSGSASR